MDNYTRKERKRLKKGLQLKKKTAVKTVAIIKIAQIFEPYNEIPTTIDEIAHVRRTYYTKGFHEGCRDNHIRSVTVNHIPVTDQKLLNILSGIISDEIAHRKVYIAGIVEQFKQRCYNEGFRAGKNRLLFLDVKLPAVLK